VYVDGALFRTLKGETIVRDFIAILEEYVGRRYGAAVGSPS
jgi:hypothetical protein